MRRLLAAALAVGLLAAPALAEGGGGSAEAGRLRVVGHGSVVLAPDFATVEVGVESRAASAAAALDANSAAARKVIEGAAAIGIPTEDVGTAAVSLMPEMRQGKDGPQPDGYRAVNTVTVRLRPLDKLGDFLRRAVDGGANRIQGVAFGLADPAKAENDARVAAVHDARRQAEAVAEAAGVTLGGIEEIGAPIGEAAPPMPRVFKAARAPRSVPIAAGTVTVDADIAVTWQIGR